MLQWMFVALSKRTLRFPLKSEGVKVSSCLVLTEAARLSGFARHLTWLGAGEFEVTIRNGPTDASFKVPSLSIS